MILITGATGNLGSSVVTQLLKTTSPNKFLVTSSNVEGISKIEEQGLQARLANFNDKNSLNQAFKGVQKILLISTMDSNRFQQHKNVVDAAKKNGVEHVIYTSLAIKNIQTSGVKDLMQSHFDSEEYIKKSGMAYTILRNTMYTDALIQILGQNVMHKDINLPGGDGRVPYALRSEMGEGLANLLLQEGHENKTYNITGSDSFGYADIAAVFSKLGGDTLHYNDISEMKYKASLKEAGYPDFAIYLHVGTIFDIKNHQYEIASNQLAMLLGRPTATLEESLKAVFQ